MYNFAINHRANGWLFVLLPVLLCTLSFNARAVYAQAPAFDQRRPFGTPLDLTRAMAVGDIDGDGDLDIIAERYPAFLTPTRIYELALNNGDGSFAAPRKIGITIGPYYDLLAGDLDGDGDLDLIASDRENFYIYYNDSTGAFPALRRFSSTAIPQALGDVDSDGDIDIVAINGKEGYVIYRNDGAGQFAPTHSFGTTVGDNGRVVLSDLDGDHDLDLLAISTVAHLYLNNNAGDFTSKRVLGAMPNSDSIAQIQLGDLDGDGDQDMVIARSSGQGLLYFNDGSGDFLLTQPFGAANAAISDLALGDVDDDGDLDIAAADRDQSIILLNNGAGAFAQLPAFSSAADRTARVALADMDGDADLDVVAGGNSGPSVVYFNNGAGNFMTPRPFGVENAAAAQVVVGDMDRDHRLDVIVAGGLFGGASSAFYRNAGDGTFPLARNFALPNTVGSVALGDLDGDGDLDIIAGGKVNVPSMVYRNDGVGNFTAAQSFDPGEGFLSQMVVAVGDIDNDGDLDIVGGRRGGGFPPPGPSTVYFNNGSGSFSPARPYSRNADTLAIALGDVDNDGDLDIVAAHYNFEASGAQPLNTIYLNDGQGNFPINRSFGVGSDETDDMALADIDRDGDLDIVATNSGKPGTLYLNDGLGNFALSRTFSSWLNAPQRVATADFDGDGDLDIIANGSNAENFIYLNDGAGNFAAPITFAGTLSDLATGDMDGDGDIDIVTVNNPGQGVVYLNQKGVGQIVAKRPGRTALADLFATPEILADRLIPISYRLTSPDRLPVGRIAAFYSINGGGQWRPAMASSNTITQNLATSPAGVEHHFIWDTAATGFFGQGDNVVVRLVAYPQARPVLAVGSFPPQARQAYTLFFPLLMQSSSPLSFNYPNLTAGPYQRPFVSTVTMPFRVRGTQVRVVDSNGQPTANAQVYRLPKGSFTDAESFPPASQPLTTTTNGYLPGRGALAIGDGLVALHPLRRGPDYTVYATSAAPNENGISFQPVTQSGVQTLTVSAAHPLILFDLDVALEWDASNDGLFYNQLTTAIQRTSALLYDVSDGQIALGEVRIHSDRADWLGADLVIYASNNLRPRASMGGVVTTAQAEMQGLRGVLPNAYLPGQVRMGPIWDPFGQNTAELTQDWQRALAHELAHYLLYLPDNYLGVEQGLLRITDCQGSFMTDAYNPGYSELLTPSQWRTPNDPLANGCLRTVAARLLTGRSDWETVTHFYPELRIPDPPLNGPALLPLNVTQVRLVAPPTAKPVPVTARNYDLRDESGSVTVLRQAQAYVLQSQGTPTTADDALLYLGSTGVGSDRIFVRGALAGDKVCVLDSDSELARTGCETVTPQSTSIQVRAVPGWQPALQVTPVTSTTFQISVTQSGFTADLQVELFPAYGAIGSAHRITTTRALLTHVGAGRYAAQLTVPYPVFEGFVRLSAPANPLEQQTITQFFLGDGWGPPNVWMGANRAWSANFRAKEAPVASGDGKVTILHLDDLLADTGATAIQAVNNLPNLPPWLTPVGAGYQIQSNSALTRTLMFQYNQRDVPPGYEPTLTIYYLAPGATDWQRLPTGPLASGVDIEDNLAVAVMPQQTRGDGLYALVATAALSPLTSGWNPFNYPVSVAQSVTRTLASLGTAYTTVYAYQPAAPLPWPVYDRTVEPTFAPVVNTLTTMTFGRNYLIYATQVVTPYVSVIGDGGIAATTQAALTSALVEPPALFYADVTPLVGLPVEVGMVVQAKIGDTICGESQIQRWQERLLFVIQVKADSSNGCGKPGQLVQFVIGGQVWPMSAPWDNHQANHLSTIATGGRQGIDPITPVLKVYLPIAGG